MTRKKLSEWLNAKGFITSPEQIYTYRLRQDQREEGTYPLWIDYKLKEFESIYCMGCAWNLSQLTRDIKNHGYELKVIRDRWFSHELTLVKRE